MYHLLENDHLYAAASVITMQSCEDVTSRSFYRTAIIDRYYFSVVWVLQTDRHNTRSSVDLCRKWLLQPQK